MPDEICNQLQLDALFTPIGNTRSWNNCQLFGVRKIMVRVPSGTQTFFLVPRSCHTEYLSYFFTEIQI